MKFENISVIKFYNGVKIILSSLKIAILIILKR